MDFKKELLKKAKFDFYKYLNEYKKEFRPSKSHQGIASGLIVGEKGYPNLNLIPLNNEDKKSSFFNEKNLVKKEYNEILKLKVKNIAGIKNLQIKERDDKILNQVRDVLASKKVVDYESFYEKEIRINDFHMDKLIGLGGNKNKLEKISSGNIPIHRDFEKVLNEDIKTKNKVIDLYKKGFNESQIINLLTLGSFGLNFNKKLVPSRWGITAYDTIISNYLFDEITKNNIINKNLYFKSEDKGNTFHIFLFPKKHTFENIEVIKTKYGVKVINDYYANNKSIQPKTAGGFFATRLSCLEFLNRIKKQASVIVIREIDNYEIPLGVIFVRETVREAFKKIYTFKDLNELKEILDEKIYQILNSSNSFKTKSIFDF